MGAGASAERKKICLVDGNSYIHRAYHAVRELKNSRGLPTNAIYGFLTMLHKVLRDEEHDFVVVVFDAGGKTFRHDLYPEYKANRPGMPDDLLVQVDYIKKLTAAFGVTSVERRGVEADDILAALGRQAEKKGMDVLYVTGDKDIQQLIGEHATVLDTMKDRRITMESFTKDRGFAPKQLVDVMALAGDSSDNIPGVPGIGPKTAGKLIREYGDLESIFCRLEEMPAGRVKDLLAENRDKAEMSRELFALHDDIDVGVDVGALKPPEEDKSALRGYFEELEFRKFQRELDLGEEEAPLEFELVDRPDEALGLMEGFDKGAPLAFSCCVDEDRGAGYVAVTGDGKRIAAARFGRPGSGGAENRVNKKMKELLENTKAVKWGHDHKTSLERLEGFGITLGGLGIDTMIAGYLLNPSEKGYLLGDLAMTYLGVSSLSGEAGGKGRQAGLFADEERLRLESGRQAAAVWRLGGILAEKLDGSGMTDLYEKVELPLITILHDMEKTGIAVDMGSLRDMSAEIETMMQKMEEEIFSLAGGRFNIASPKQLAEVLFERLGLPAMKKTKTGYSTNEEVLTALAVHHHLPSVILGFRQLAKLKNTYVDVLPQLVSPEDGRIHTTFNQAVTATGRLSSSSPNLQNIPVRTEWGRRIRRAFVPRKGWSFISADYSQIELRVLAHLSGDETLIEAFGKGEDIHTRTASELFRVGGDEVTREMRRTAKVINFGIIYGMSPFGLSKQLGIGQKEARKYIDDYFTVYRGVRSYLTGLVEGARERGYVSTLFGRRRYLAELQSDKPQVVQFAERAALNTPIQGTAADLIKMAMISVVLALAETCSPSKLLVQIHDELLLESPPDEVERTAALVRECMEGVCSFRVPIVVDIKSGANWAELH